MTVQVIMVVPGVSAAEMSHKFPDALVIEYDKRQMWRGGICAAFPRTKFNFAFIVVRRLGGLITREEIADELWGHLEDGGPEQQWKVFDVHLCKLRQSQLPALGIDLRRQQGRGLYLVDIRDNQTKEAV